MRHSRILVLALTAALFIAIIPPGPGPISGSDAWVLEAFNGTENETTLTFGAGGGTDDSTTLGLPQNAPIYNARFKVEGLKDDSGKYPANIWLDVGKDGDFEWMFWGEGYGALGKQTRFSTNDTKALMAFSGDSVNDSVKIRIPAGAKVASATMDIEGRAGINNGVKLIRSDATACQIYGYSSNSAYDPKLTIYYLEGGSTLIQQNEAEMKDTMVSAASAGTNYGNGWSLLSHSSSSENRALLKFDLSTVDPDKNVSSAIMEVRFYSYNSDQDWGAHEILGSWDELTATWNNQPSHIATEEDTFHVNYQYSSAWADFDITSLLAKWLGYLPTNVTIDLGDDGDVEYETVGVHDYINTSVDIADGLNSYLAAASPTFTDDYGNKFVDVPLHASSDSTGTLKVSNVTIEYEWAATVYKNPNNFNLTNELNAQMLIIPAVNENVPIPVNIHAGTAGKLRLQELDLTYNGRPRQLMDLPSDLSLDEDTTVLHLLDLSEYFEDDYMDGTALDYTIMGNSQNGKVNIYSTDIHWLAVDCQTEPEARDFNGPVTFKVRVTDEMGNKIDSNQVTVTVNPINDEPVRSDEMIPDMTLVEGGSSVPYDLDEGKHFTDAEGDGLIFSAVVDPLATYEGEELTVDIDNVTKEMVIRAHGDFFGDNVPVRVFCDDGIGEPAGVYRDLLVEVINVNDDPPVWTPIPDVTVEEDGRAEDAVDLGFYVTDVDNEFSDLRFTVMSISNSSAVSVKLDQSDYLDIRAVGENWTGTAVVKLKATDDGKNSAETTFNVIVKPVNDLPLVSLRSPGKAATITTTRVTLEWAASDAETPADELTYNIYAGDGSAETLVAGDVSGIRYELKVEDGRTYHWTVSASDGTGYGPKARERTFVVDLSAGPRATLESPLDGSFVTGESVTLTWTSTNRPAGGGGTVRYDVYMGAAPGSLDLLEEGLTETTWDASGLENGKDYFWTVVPRDGLGAGTCLSGTWSIIVDFAFGGYGAGISADPAALTLRPGSTGALTATLQNTGAADDNYKLSGSMSAVPGAQILIDTEDPDNIPIAVGGTSPITITVMVPGSTAPGTYTLTLVTKSLRGGMEQALDVTFTVSETAQPTTQDPSASSSDDKGGLFEGDGGTLALLFLVIMIVLVVIFAAMFMMYRRKSNRLDELEGRRRLEPAAMVDAELAFSPDGAAGAGLGGAGGAVPYSQQLGAGGEAGAGGAGVMEPLALPKVATGGEVPPGGDTATAAWGGDPAVAAGAAGTPDDEDIVDFGIGATAPKKVAAADTPELIDAEVSGTGTGGAKPLTPPPPSKGARPRPKPGARPGPKPEATKPGSGRRPKPTTGPRSKPGSGPGPKQKPKPPAGKGAEEKGEAGTPGDDGGRAKRPAPKKKEEEGPLGTLPGE